MREKFARLTDWPDRMHEMNASPFPIEVVASPNDSLVFVDGSFDSMRIEIDGAEGKPRRVRTFSQHELARMGALSMSDRILLAELAQRVKRIGERIRKLEE